MLGAILGDIVGSPYEFDCNNYKHKNFPLLSARSRFTDDTVMTLAVAQGLLAGRGIPERTFAEVREAMRVWGEAYPMPVTAECSAAGCIRSVPGLTAASATVRPCGCRRRGGCSIRWKRPWKWQR